MTTLLTRGMSRLLPLTFGLGLAAISVAGVVPGQQAAELKPVATVTVTIPVTTWTAVNSAQPNTSYWTGSYRDYVRVGKNSSDSSVWRGILQANITALEGRTITSATLTITLDHSASCSVTGVSAYQFMSSITSQAAVTWNSSAESWGSLLDTQTARANESGACGAMQPDAVVQFGGPELTDALAQVSGSGGSTFTVGLRAPNEGSAMEWKKFHPTNIGLSVTYLN